MRLDIRYRTRFEYDALVRESQNELRAAPMSDPRQLLIQPWDASAVKLIEKAILNSDLGINPQNGEVTWASNGNVIVDMGPNSGTRTDIARLADWFASGEKKSEVAYKKLQSLVI